MFTLIKIDYDTGENRAYRTFATREEAEEALEALRPYVEHAYPTCCVEGGGADGLLIVTARETEHIADMERVAKLVQGRNRSVQVKEWSLNDFRGGFNWLKDHIDRNGGPFNGKIGWEENSPAPVSVLDLISILTLFHRAYSGRAGRRRNAPTVAFSSKGTADKRFLDEGMAEGYKALKPVIEDILRLHDHIYASFQPAYERYNRDVRGKGSKLAKRRGFENKPTPLPLTGTESEYRIDKGMLFPLLAALRALLHYPNEVAEWRTPPVAFFEEYGADLVGRLFDEYEKMGNNPAAVGKNRSVYETLNEKAENFYLLSKRDEDLDEELETA